jgi:hypothetical protein
MGYSKSDKHMPWPLGARFAQWSARASIQKLLEAADGMDHDLGSKARQADESNSMEVQVWKQM